MHFFSLAMDFRAKERVKVLETVTVSALEHALHRGFNRGDRNMVALVKHLNAISWKTAPAKHLRAYEALQYVILKLLAICKHGLVPDSKLHCVTRLQFICASIFFILKNLHQYAKSLPAPGHHSCA